jgi:DNA-binding transcriptional ArsR family regulator
MARNGVPSHDEAAKAIGHETRRRMLKLLQAQPKSPAQLARQLKQPVNLIAYHMGELEKRGVVELVHTRPRRGSTEHFYRVCCDIKIRTAGKRVFVPRKGGRSVFETPAEIVVKRRPKRAKAAA